jgi:hypothetical protein
VLCASALQWNGGRGFSAPPRVPSMAPEQRLNGKGPETAATQIRTGFSQHGLLSPPRLSELPNAVINGAFAPGQSGRIWGRQSAPLAPSIWAGRWLAVCHSHSVLPLSQAQLTPRLIGLAAAALAVQSPPEAGDSYDMYIWIINHPFWKSEQRDKWRQMSGGSCSGMGAFSGLA